MGKIEKRAQFLIDLIRLNEDTIKAIEVSQENSKDQGQDKLGNLSGESKSQGLGRSSRFTASVSSLHSLFSARLETSNYQKMLVSFYRYISQRKKKVFYSLE